MGMTIRTNTGGNTSCRNLKKTSKKSTGNLEKLASGYQINRAADDASGLAITEKMWAQITALEKYSENSEDGISLIQTAEGYLGEVHDMLDRMYELCCTCNRHYSIEFTDEETTPTSPEISGSHYIYKVSLRGCVTGDDVMDRIIQATGGQPNHHYTNFEKKDGKLMVRENRNIEKYGYARPYKSGGYGLFGSGVAVESKTTEKTETTIIQRVEQETVEIKNLEHTGRVIAINAGEKKVGKVYISLPEMSASTLDTRMVNVMDMDSAVQSTEIVKNAINTISMERAVLGAQQNRLDYTIDDLDTTHENMSAAKSRIKDADISKEMMSYTQNNVLTQAAQSMLSQANTQPQNVLQLLQ